MDRKEDTRKKIQLGGLFVKAGLDDMHPADAYISYMGCFLIANEHYMQNRNYA